MYVCMYLGMGPGTLASGKLISTQYKPLEPGRTVDGGKVHSAALRKPKHTRTLR